MPAGVCSADSLRMEGPEWRKRKAFATKDAKCAKEDLGCMRGAGLEAHKI